jgi:hypothetical protein
MGRWIGMGGWMGGGCGAKGNKERTERHTGKRHVEM